MTIEFSLLNTQQILSASEQPPFNREWTTGPHYPDNLSTNDLINRSGVREWLENKGLPDPDDIDEMILEDAVDYKRTCSQISPDSRISHLASETVESVAQLALMKDPNQKLMGTIHVVNDLIDSHDDWGKDQKIKHLPKKIIVGLATQLIRFSNMTDVEQLSDGIRGLLYRGVTRGVLYQELDYNFIQLLRGSKLDTERFLKDAAAFVNPPQTI